MGRVITVQDLERVVDNIDYAIVRQSNLRAELVNVFIKVDGRSIETESESAWTVPGYRNVKEGRPNAIIYDCGDDGVEIVIKYPNGYGVSAISTPAIKGGREMLEVAIKKGSRVTYNTSITDDYIECASVEELKVIMEHVSNLSVSGYGYVGTFVPNPRYNKRNILKEVMLWSKAIPKMK